MPDNVEMLADLLKAVNRVIHDTARQVSHEYGLTPPTMHVLGRVMHDRGQTVSEISRRMGLAKSHVSRTVDQLCALGLVEKRPDETDQRLVRIYSSKKADDHFIRVQAAIRLRLSSAISTLPEETLEEIIDGLRLLRTALEQG